MAKNIFSREATYDTNDYMEFASYNVTLESTGEIKINDLNNNSEYVDEVYAIAESIKLTNLLAESLEVDYLPEVKGAIVRVFMKNGDSGDYYYQEEQFNAFDVGGQFEKDYILLANGHVTFNDEEMSNILESNTFNSGTAYI